MPKKTGFGTRGKNVSYMNFIFCLKWQSSELVKCIPFEPKTDPSTCIRFPW
jgi:hypothetical protein